MKVLMQLFAITLLVISSTVWAAQWPEGMSFIGLKQGAWRLYGVWNGALKPIVTSSEPRTATFNVKKMNAAYIGTDGHLHEVSLSSGEDKVILAASKERALTQPVYDAAGDRLFVVGMEGGSSVGTEIVAVGPDRKTTRTVTSQPGAQFEPDASRNEWLIYSSVSCTVGCGRIIQEIWRKNLASGAAEQLTLTNAISREALPSRDGRWVYFSSNRAGNYHLWRVPFDGGAPEQLTQGVVTDISPAVDGKGNLYFVRHTADGGRLMKMDANGSIASLDLPDGIEDIRDLEILP
jgi:hypothetical protein